jgi:cellulose synthase/poly-beta-1,6-N-acetylglucosamine synthase-like glycosyltransferase
MIFKKSVLSKHEKVMKKVLKDKNKVVYIIYPTMDDFIEKAALTAINQTYKNIKFYILDDSREEKYKNLIDNFAKKHNCEIVRRNGVGAKNKSGNINFFLNKHKDFDYLSIMDADTYLSENFIENSLKYFETFKDVGIVQGLEILNYGTNKFQHNSQPSYSNSKKY